MTAKTCPDCNLRFDRAIGGCKCPKPEPKDSRAAMSLKRVNLEKVHKQLLNVISRDVEHLLRLSMKKKLNSVDSASLVSYLKLMPTLQKIEAEGIDELSDAELEKIATSPKPEPEPKEE